MRTGRNLTYDLMEQLGRAIVIGQYGADCPFPTEAELTNIHGTSRSVTREAVKMLTTKGLLSARPRQGTVVQPESDWNLLDPDVLRWHLERQLSLGLLTEFTQMRLAVEPLAATLAARRGDRESIAEISKAIDRMRAAEHGHDDVLSADIAFHVATLNASGNRFFASLSGMISTALHISIRFTNRRKGVRIASIEAHENVLSAIVAGNGEAASAAMSVMLAEAIELFESAEEEESMVKVSQAVLF